MVKEKVPIYNNQETKWNKVKANNTSFQIIECVSIEDKKQFPNRIALI